jgi:hypothetical protein
MFHFFPTKSLHLGILFVGLPVAIDTLMYPDISRRGKEWDLKTNE